MTVAAYPRCGFCGHTERDDPELLLIAGPSTMICEQCVDICAEVLRRQRQCQPEPPP